ncbi:hypothetical protein ACOSQ3_019190 [Xanthoceras sorbifolium]
MKGFSKAEKVEFVEYDQQKPSLRMENEANTLCGVHINAGCEIGVAEYQGIHKSSCRDGMLALAQFVVDQISRLFPNSLLDFRCLHLFKVQLVGKFSERNFSEWCSPTKVREVLKLHQEMKDL